MTKEQFQVGMRVIAVDKCDGIDIRSQRGTIRSIRGSGTLKIGVEFDKAFPGGHTLGGILQADSQRGRWCAPESLIRENGIRLVIEGAEDETTIKGFFGTMEIDAKAKCAAGDTPNAYVGALMALKKAFGLEEREAKSGEHVVVVHPMAAEGYTIGDVLRMYDFACGENTRNGRLVACYPREYEVVRDPVIFHLPKRERKAVCIKAAPDDSFFREGRIYTVDGDDKIDTGSGKVQTHQQEDARRIAAGKNRFFIIDEDEKES